MKVDAKKKKSLLEDPVNEESGSIPRVSHALLVVSAVSLLVFWPLAVVLLFRGKTLGFAISLFASGLAQGPILAGYAFASADRKQWWRWLVLAISGLGILLFSLVDTVNLDMDGFFELLILGAIGPAFGHTIVTTILGPLFFGRVLCGWGCWRAMVLERLPVGKGLGRRKGVWVWMPLVGVAVSIAAAAMFALVLDSKSGETLGHIHSNGFWPVVSGIAVYYAASIVLALALRDQRAFCKYLCPSGFIMRWTSRPALLHVFAQADVCNDCEACTDSCPMDIPIAERVKNGISIGKGDCILCQRCVESCPTGALKTIFKK
ncbi:MAG: 4Fe-4S dicluster domain-containing protein [Ignavibacteriae bacterium]|nr:MAG: 4Fe-4S dicluster domain-containing protein [Ignavibacteriota bacterium]